MAYTTALLSGANLYLDLVELRNPAGPAPPVPTDLILN